MIIAALAFIVAAVPGGGEAARAIVTALTIGFLVALGLIGYQLYRQNQLALLALEERSRTMLLAALGAIVLMLAGADELTASGVGLLIWLLVLGLSIFALVRVWGEARSSF